MFKPILVIFVIVCGSGVLSSEQITKVGEDGLEAFVFPWATYIEVLNENTMESQFECLGSIIGPDWVLVQARCFTRTMDNGAVRLHFGTVNFTQPEISMVSRTYYIHPEHNVVDVFENNVALIQLPMSLQFSPYIDSISLPFNIDVEQFIGTKADFVGRRHMINPLTRISHAILRWNTLEIISDEDCDLHNAGRVSTEMCALGTAENPTKTPCQSLGHLAVYHNSTYYLIGGGGESYCHDNVWPNFFPRISAFLDWITDTTGISE